MNVNVKMYKGEKMFGLNISLDENMDYKYGDGIFGPIAEKRYLSDISQSLGQSFDKDMLLYSIAMDVGDKRDYIQIKKRNLLFGIVSFSPGRILNGPVRSQGHIHSISKSCNSSTPEVYQIEEGDAIIYMQENSDGDAGDCYVVRARQGDVVIVPPNWTHATINANSDRKMIFGAWCVRDYGFDYGDIRKNKGIAFFPYFKDGEMSWEFNKHYSNGKLHIVNARKYDEFDIGNKLSIYEQFKNNNDLFLFVSNPNIVKEKWEKEKICKF